METILSTLITALNNGKLLNLKFDNWGEPKAQIVDIESDDKENKLITFLDMNGVKRSTFLYNIQGFY